MIRARRILMPALAGLAASLALAETPGPALAIPAESATLQWGPCPSFIPAGCEIAVLHGNPAESNADVFFKVPGDFTIPKHWHTSAERMVLVSGELRVSYEGQQPVTLKPGMYAYGPSRLAHEAYCLEGDPCILFIAFVAPVDAVATAAAGP